VVVEWRLEGVIVSPSPLLQSALVVLSCCHFTIINDKKCYSFACDRSIRPHGLFIFLFHTCDEFVVMNRPSMSWPISASKYTLCSLLFYYFIYTCIIYCMYVHYLEVFLYFRDQRTRSLFRVGRCSLNRGLFTAKIDRGDWDMCSNRRCSLTEVLLYITDQTQ